MQWSLVHDELRTDLKLCTVIRPKVAGSNCIARIVRELDIKSSWGVTSTTQALFPRWTRVWGLSQGQAGRFGGMLNYTSMPGIERRIAKTAA